MGSATHGAWLGSYEADKQRLFSALVSPEAVIYDIGANVGVYTLLGSVLAPRGHVYAFEPLPQNLRYLREHVRLNALGNVIVVPKAVAEKSGSLRFAPAASPSMGKLDVAGALAVEAVSLDEFVAAGAMVPTLLKIDVEGGEVGVLRGAQRILREHRPPILLATHGAEIHRECCESLVETGYRLTPLGGGDLARCDEVYAS